VDTDRGIKTLPVRREVTHCKRTWHVSPFDFYTTCPDCGTQIKVRSCSGVTEVEDVFDAVFEWMNQPGAQELVESRQRIIEQDRSEE
jgi:hypothetical protein